MAYSDFSGQGEWLGYDPSISNLLTNGAFTAALIDATGEKVGFTGRVWFPARTGSKSIRRVHFRFGTVTKAGGSGLTVSLQDVSTTSGPPAQPDETQDQTVAIANGDAAFASNTWMRTGTLSADRSVAYGELVAIAIEFDGGGRLGADAVNVALTPCSPALGTVVPVLKTGGTWAVVSASTIANVVLEFSDGTFGTLEGSYPIKAFNTHTFNSGSAADEFAMPLMVTQPGRIDCLRAVVAAPSNADFDLALYQGTTLLASCSIDANTLRAASAIISVDGPIAAVDIAANTQYYVAVKPTTANNVSCYSLDVDDANHLTVYPGGPNLTYTNRVDAGAWAAVTATRRLLVAARFSAFSDGGAISVQSNTTVFRSNAAGVAY